MKFFSKSIFIVLLGFQSVSVFSGKVFIYFIYCFSVLFLSGSNSLSVNKEFVSLKGEEKQNKKSRDYFVEERAVSKSKRQEEEQKARGLVLRFHHWSTLKEQKELASLLKARGLKRTKNIKSFKAQLFGWEGGGLKPSSLGEKACLKLKSLSYVRRCSPDTLLPVSSIKVATNILSQLSVNSIKNSTNTLSQFSRMTNKKTEAGFNVECKNCRNQELESLIAVSQKALDIKTCDIVSGKLGLMEGKLSDYWAQELIGSDLLREELEKIPPPDIENWIAVFDSKEKDHNINVKNLISDEDLHAVLPELGERKVPFLEVGPNLESLRDYKKMKRYKPDKRVDLQVLERDYKKAKRYKSALSMYETSYPGDYLFGFKKRPPHYINNSTYWHGSENIYEVFKELSSSGVSRSIVVLASGNLFPKRLDDIERKASKDYDVIIVGSFSPKGFVSASSQSDEELSILAPSDNWLTSAGKNGEYKKFGGSSGAAPLVTGSLAGFEWLSGYHPTAKEAKVLLEKTALPTLHSFEKPPINGAGLLNAYKLGEVAKRLKEKCGPSISCFKEEILKDKNYHFPEDKSLKRDVASFFSFCSARGESGALSDLSNCEEKEKLFKRLRKAVLLKPSEELLKSLSCIYKAGGFKQNAEALDKLAMALGTEEEVRAKLKERLSKKKPVSSEILRLALGMGGFEEEFDSSEWNRAFNIAEKLGEMRLPLLEAGFTSGVPKLQYLALFSAGKIGEKGLPLLKAGFASGVPKLQKKALFSAGKIGEKGLPLLEAGFASDVRELRKEALRSARWLGEKGLPLLKEGFKSGDRVLKELALDSAGWVGEKGLPLLKEGFESGDRELKKQVLYSAERIGKKGIPLLVKAFESDDWELQKVALRVARNIILNSEVKRKRGGKIFPLLVKAFESDDRELQKAALYSMALTGEKGLPLLEEGFESGDRELQQATLYSAKFIGKKGLPLLRKVLKNQTNLDEDIRIQIKSYLKHR